MRPEDEWYKELTFRFGTGSLETARADGEAMRLFHIMLERRGIMHLLGDRKIYVPVNLPVSDAELVEAGKRLIAKYIALFPEQSEPVPGLY